MTHEQQVFLKFAIIIPIFTTLLASCANEPTSAVPPEWALHGVEKAYPRETYIAVEGYGKTPGLAEQNAIAALSRYFIAEVTSNTQSRQTWATGMGYNEQLSDETVVQSTTKLFTVRRTSPWYNSVEKNYAVVAYIDHSEAWAVLEPRILKETGEFRSLWSVAESENIVLKSYFDYKRVLAHIRRQEFTETINFGEVVNSKKTDDLTGDIRRYIAELSAKLNETRNMAQIFIDCPHDFESLISTALKKALSTEGLSIAVDKKRAAAICVVTVEEGFWPSEGIGDFYYPKSGVVITDTAGRTLFSYSTATGKQGAMSAEVAKRRAYTALAANIETDFSAQLNKGLGVH